MNKLTPTLPVIIGTMMAGASLSACDSSGDQASVPKAAVLTVYVDVSRSTPLIDKPEFAARAVAHIGEAVSALELGDEIHILVVGNRSADRSISLPPIVTGYTLRIPAARAQVEKALHDIVSQNATERGDDSTNLIFALENSQPVCTPRSKVIAISDGLEASDTYSVVRPLAEGQAIEFPPAQRPYLKGCAIEFYGVGISSATGSGIQSQPLSSAQIQALTRGWQTYLASAGVKNTDMAFTSILMK